MTEVVANTGVTAQRTVWQFELEAGVTEVEQQYAAIDEPDRLLLTGLGEKDVMGIAQRLSDRGVSGLAVASLAYPDVKGKLSGSDTGQVVTKATEALVRHITGKGRGLRQAFGNSAGASQLLISEYENPGLYKHLVAVAPLLNHTALGSKPSKQARELLTRFDAAGMTSNDDGQTNGFALMKEVMGGLAYTGEQDAMEIFTALRPKLKIYVGAKDSVVPASESEAVVGKEALIRVPGMGHVSLLDEAGCDDMALLIRTELASATVE